MSFTVKQIKAILSNAGVPSDALDATAEEICSRHNTGLDAIKEERDALKEESKKFTDAQAELNKLRQQLESNEKDPFKVKYEALKEEFEGYKTETTKKETTASKTKAYKELLKELRINGKITDKVLKLADLETVELDDKGTIKDADKLKESLKNEWADFIVKEGSEGGRVDNPPANNNVDADKMSDDDYYKSIFKKKE
jgi:DNA repair exonuclease SbcCD ATPase subunit